MTEFTMSPDALEEQALLTPKIAPQYQAKTAGFWMRLWAFIIDSLIVTSVGGLLIFLVFTTTGLSLTRATIFAPALIAGAIVYYGYFVIMTFFFGQTLGKMVLGLRVVTLSGKDLTFTDVLFREWIGRFMSNCFLHLPYLFIVILPENQALHDYFADTKVIHENTFVAEQA